MPVGKLGPFDSSTESFENYVDRLGHYFAANDIGDNKKKSVFLAACGPKLYDTLKNLCLPEKPDDFTFRVIIKKLKDHLKPAPLLVFERYRFGKKVRKPDEKISDFALELRKLSATCEFGDFLDSALWMQFVVGLNHPKIQDRLIQEKTMTFSKAWGLPKVLNLRLQHVQRSIVQVTALQPQVQAIVRKSQSTK